MKTIFATALFGIACSVVGVPHAAQATIPADPKLFLSSDGLAFSWFPGKHELERVVHVDRTQGADPVSWTAVSNQPWLSVSASGMTGGSMAIKANPSGLKRNRFYRATITVSTSESDFTDSETVAVGFWVGLGDPKNINIKEHVTQIVANPVEPIVYVTDGGNSIREYNVYSGALVATLQNVAPTIGQLKISSDGQILFVSNTTNRSVVELAADGGARIGAFPLGYQMDPQFTMEYARPLGLPALYASGHGSDHPGPIFSIPSGTILGLGVPSGFIAVTPDGRQIFSLTQGISPATLFGYSVDLTNGLLTATRQISRRTSEENCQDLAVSHDGKRVYPACGAPYVFEVYSAKTLDIVQTLAANAYPQNIEIDAKNHVVGGISALSPEIYVFNQEGASLGTVSNLKYASKFQQPAAMKVSGDAMRVIFASWDPPGVTKQQILMFRTLPSKQPG